MEHAKLVVEGDNSAWFQCPCQLCGMWFMVKIRSGEYVPLFCQRCQTPPATADKST